MFQHRELGASMLSSNNHFPHEYKFGLLGKSQRNINADCRGHDFDRPRKLPRTGYEHQADTASYNWSVPPVEESLCLGDFEEGLGVSSPMRERHICRPIEIVTRQKTVRDVHSTFNKRERSNITAKTRTRRQLLTGAHLAHEIKKVRKANPPYIEHAGEHDWQTTKRWACTSRTFLVNTQTADMSKEA